jgi:hypothetical protein
MNHRGVCIRLGSVTEARNCSKPISGWRANLPLRIKTLVVAVAITSATSLLVPSNLHALASFARQTGLTCTACHLSFPELTSTGREFKLNAFTTATEDKIISEEGSGKMSALSILDDFPLTVNVQASMTYTDKNQPGAQNPSVEFPQQINVLLAGQVSPHIGTFLQLTYGASADTINGDSSEVRFVAAKTQLAGENFVWGIDANNNPMMEDLWNSTPAFGFSYASPDSAGFVPPVSTLIDGGLATQVIGAGPYFMWANHLYGVVEAYRSQHLGAAQPENGFTGATANPINISWVAPYWRLAWQQSIDKNNYLELGTYGIYVNSYPGAVGGSSTDNYLDLAGDASYQLSLGNGDTIVLHTTFIHEIANPNVSEPGVEAELNTFRADVAYHFGNTVVLTAGPFITWGTTDAILYGGNPNTNGVIAQAAYWPWQNFEIGLQYRAFLMYNGASTNYDGAGRNASDNNTLYAFFWFNF